jgi:hypothetical protein
VRSREQPRTHEAKSNEVGVPFSEADEKQATAGDGGGIDTLDYGATTASASGLKAASAKGATMRSPSAQGAKAPSATGAKAKSTGEAANEAAGDATIHEAASDRKPDSDEASTGTEDQSAYTKWLKAWFARLDRRAVDRVLNREHGKALIDALRAEIKYPPPTGSEEDVTRHRGSGCKVPRGQIG